MEDRHNILSFTPGENLHKWFEKCYELNFPNLYQYALRVTKDTQLAEDIVSEVFMNLWNTRDKLSGVKKIDAYLFISVKNAAINYLTKNPARFSSSDFSASLKEIDSHDPEQMMLEQELVEALNKAIKSLPDKCQVVFQLVRMEGKSYKEVAEEMGISEGTVKNHMTKAIAKIREQVIDYIDDPGYSYPNYGTLYLILLLGGL